MTAIAGMVELGVRPHVIERCTDYKLIDVAGIPISSDPMAECRAAMEGWANKVSEIIGSHATTIKYPQAERLPPGLISQTRCP
jgi:hypothetical protein